MKPNIDKWVAGLREGAATVLRRYPLEAVLLLGLTVSLIVCYEREWIPSPRLAAAGWGAALLLAVNLAAGRTVWRRIYRVAWVPLVPLALWPGFPDWLETTQAVVTLSILTPLALLACRRAADNRRFVSETVVWLRSGLLSLFFAYAAYGLFEAILWSAAYIFGFGGAAWVFGLSMDLFFVTQCFAVPVLFLMMLDRWLGRAVVGSRVAEVLSNYVLSPAIVAYAALLYLYLLKILVTRSLPEGGVAYLVFGFTMTALAVKALGRLLEKRIYDWFFDRFSLVSLPVLALFWIGVVRRTNEYGLTEPRVYLVVCGGLMTLCVLLFLSQRTGRYLWVCLAAWVSFAALAYVPFLEPERIAVQSQTQRAERVAERLGRFGGDGRLLLTPMPLADTVYKKEYRKLYESLDYIRRDSAAFARFGVKDLDDLAAIFPEPMRDYVRWGYDWSCVDTCVDTNIIELEAPVNVRFEVNAEYPHYYTNLRNWHNDHSYDVSNDTLRLFLGEECAVYRISCRDLLERQLERSGFDPAEACEPAPEQLLRLLDYRDDRCRILFENIKLERTDSAVVIQGMAINAVLMR